MQESVQELLCEIIALVGEQQRLHVSQKDIADNLARRYEGKRSASADWDYVYLVGPGMVRLSVSVNRSSVGVSVRPARKKRGGKSEGD